MSDFSKDPRFHFQVEMQPVADNLYRSIIPSIVSIERFPKGTERHILDREFAIDVEFTLLNKMILTVQEKFRTFGQGYSDVTVEYENNPVEHTPGDWYYLAAQLYFNGWASEDKTKFEKWILLDWLQVVLETQKGNIPWRIRENRDGRAKASFVYASMTIFPANCIIASSWAKK